VIPKPDSLFASCARFVKRVSPVLVPDASAALFIQVDLMPTGMLEHWTVVIDQELSNRRGSTA
jgi:hypothetical protein